MSSNMKSAIGVTIAAVLIFAAAFMPWGQIRGTPNSLAQIGHYAHKPFADLLQQPIRDLLDVTITITGWNGSIPPGGLLQNWLVVVAAGSVATLSWLKATSVWNVPSAVPCALAGYGILHAGFALAWLMVSDKGSVGIGSLLTVLAFVGVMVILGQQLRWRKAASAPNQPPQSAGPA